ncbi:MAG: tyrosine-type recombinase/integrase [Lysobacterales bacterium]
MGVSGVHRKKSTPMALSVVAVRNAKPRSKAYKLYDRDGLYLLVNTKGRRYWRFKYRFAGSEKVLALGTGNDVSLKQARLKTRDARDKLDQGIDPSVAKRLAKKSQENTFGAVTAEWMARFSPTWRASTLKAKNQRLDHDILPWLRNRPIADIEPPEVLDVLRRIEKRGALETTHRVKQIIGQVMRFAVATGRAQRDQTADLRGALPPVISKHHAGITDPESLSMLLKAIWGYEGNVVVKIALRLTPYLFVRPGELRKASWEEFDLPNAEWRIRAERMKMARPHRIPLSPQVVKWLKELQPLTGKRPYAFASLRTPRRPMSNMTINAALRALGYDGRTQTAHGFRTTASTLLHEQGWESIVIERQLAHTDANSTRAAYDRSEHWPKRKKMMTDWANYLDTLRQAK